MGYSQRLYIHPTNSPHINYKALVQCGYDLYATAYAEARQMVIESLGKTDAVLETASV